MYDTCAETRLGHTKRWVCGQFYVGGSKADKKGTLLTFFGDVILEAREHAKRLVEYFERIAHEYPSEVWWKGLSTAQQWLRLFDANEVSQPELAAFIGIVHANRYRSGGWFDLALGAYHWISEQDFLVPPFDIFFASDGLGDVNCRKVAPQEHATMLLKYFEQYHLEDPNSEVWSLGVQTMREWLGLLETEGVTKPEVSTLVESVVESSRKYPSQGWFDTILAVCNWCQLLGLAELIPEDFRSILVSR